MSEMTLWLIKILSLLFLNDPSVAAAALLLLGTFKNYVGMIGIKEINFFSTYVVKNVKILSLLFLNDPFVAAAALLLLGTFKN